MPRVKMFDRNEALMKALYLFWNKGFETTSLTDLTTELNIGKGSFYDTYGSKRDIFDEALDVYKIQGYETLDLIFSEKSNPIEGIKNFLEKHTEIMLEDSNTKGCFIANSTSELSNDEKISTFLKEHNSIMKSKLVNYLRKGQFKEDVDVIADAILTHATGISVLSQIIKDKSRFKASNDLFIKLLLN